MAKSIVVKPKRRGRPPEGGRDPLVGVRFPEKMIAQIDAHATAKGIKRSEAIRQLVGDALKGERSGR